MYLFFDTETTGLPKNWKAKATDVDNWPRITQLAIIVTDENFKVQHEYSELVKPDDWSIPKEKFFIDNNMSTERCEQYGYPISKTLNSFVQLLKGCDYVVAHNMNFDLKVISAEMIRAGIKTNHPTKKICSMLSTRDYFGTGKWPSLIKLHTKIFGADFGNAHDALADVRATVRCVKYLTENGLVTNWGM
jgi:DNA polymerase-3 subunit epsilon